MLTAITIENFKGISEPVRLELRPITLLFGHNSAGKSSLLHALIYAREVFERHNLDADQTLSAGEHLNLGGFRTFVHDHDVSRPIRLKFELDLNQIDLPGSWEYYGDGHIQDPEFQYLSSRVKTAEVGITIVWAARESMPFIRTYEISVNGVKFGRVFCPVPGKGSRILDLNADHPIFNTGSNIAAENEEEPPAYFRTLLEEIQKWLTPTGEAGAIGLKDQFDALPEFNVLESQSHYHLMVQFAEDELNWNWDGDLNDFYETRPRLILLERILYQLFVGPGLLLRDALRQFRYIGPQRQVPPRGYIPPRQPDPTRWANGMAGWDLLFKHPKLVDSISRLLTEQTKLNLAYTLELVQFRVLEEQDQLLAALRANRIDDLADIEQLINRVPTHSRLLFRPTESPNVLLEPADLGVGVSQMIPVLAAGLDDQPTGNSVLPAQLVAVEHPELNLHPRLQAEIADVFLEGALAEATKGRIFFIETHSEVFTLRLFRRVRESHQRHSNPPPADGPGEAGITDWRVKPTDVGVWYVDRSSGTVIVKRIAVDVEGELIQPWPEDDSLFEQDFREKYS